MTRRRWRSVKDWNSLLNAVNLPSTNSKPLLFRFMCQESYLCINLHGIMHTTPFEGCTRLLFTREPMVLFPLTLISPFMVSTHYRSASQCIHLSLKIFARTNLWCNCMILQPIFISLVASLCIAVQKTA